MQQPQPQPQPQPQQMMPMMPSFPPASITTEQIQRFLDENKKLILAILDNQNLGKLNECAQYQAILQRNLMYLAAIADAQPQGPAMPPQMSPHPAMQQGGFYMQQHPQAQAQAQTQAQAQVQAQAAAMAQQSPGGFPPRNMPLQYNNPPVQVQDHQQQLHHQQAIHAQQMGIRPPLGVNNGMHHPMQPADTNLGSSGPSAAAAAAATGSNKQDAPPEAGTTGGDGQGSSAAAGEGGEEAK